MYFDVSEVGNVPCDEKLLKKQLYDFGGLVSIGDIICFFLMKLSIRRAKCLERPQWYLEVS